MQGVNVSPAAEPGIALRIITPAGIAYEGRCGSVTLPLADDSSGAGGGSIGIRRGHIRAAMALSEGDVCAHTGGTAPDTVRIAAGFASVDNDVVTVITERAQLMRAESSEILANYEKQPRA